MCRWPQWRKIWRRILGQGGLEGKGGRDSKTPDRPGHKHQRQAHQVFSINLSDLQCIVMCVSFTQRIETNAMLIQLNNIFKFLTPPIFLEIFLYFKALQILRKMSIDSNTFNIILQISCVMLLIR